MASGSCIDLISISATIRQVDWAQAAVGPISPSDHLPLSVVMAPPLPPPRYAAQRLSVKWEHLKPEHEESFVKALNGWSHRSYSNVSKDHQSLVCALHSASLSALPGAHRRGPARAGHHTNRLSPFQQLNDYGKGTQTRALSSSSSSQPPSQPNISTARWAVPMGRPVYTTKQSISPTASWTPNRSL
jgi:hypothetical protein